MQEANSKFRVLIVDDDIHIQESLTMFLEDSGFQVKACSCKEEALKVMTEFPVPSACLIDLNLDGENGETIAAEILRTSPQTRCLIFSGTAYKISHELKNLGMSQNNVIQKPIVDFDHLIQKIVT